MSFEISGKCPSSRARLGIVHIYLATQFLGVFWIKQGIRSEGCDESLLLSQLKEGGNLAMKEGLSASEINDFDAHLF